jgi:RNA polymerase sigma-70 factor (ECF subfamily)
VEKKSFFPKSKAGQSKSRSKPRPDTAESALISAALQGDAGEFSRLTEPYRKELQVHCYRILGSLQEAEDMVQETFLRAWRHLDSFEGRSSLRAWLYKIATNACLDAIDRKKARRSLPPRKSPAADPLAQISPPSTETTWLEPFPDEWLVDAAAGPEARYLASESVTLAFLAALQALPARQRAVLILKDVLDWQATEVAEMTGLTTSAVNSALHRARVTLSKNYHHRGMEKVAQSQADLKTQELLDQYVQAWERADVDGLVALLKDEAVFSMPPSPSWYAGKAAIRTFIAATVFADHGMFPGVAAGRWRLLPTRANQQPAYAIYQKNEGGGYQAFGMHVIDVQAGRIAEVVSFVDPTLPERFKLPSMFNTESGLSQG